MSEIPLPTVFSEEEQGRVEAIDREAAAGPAGVDALVARLSDPSWAVRRRAVAALARIGDPAVRSLGEVIRRERRDETKLAAAIDALVVSSGEVEDEVLSIARSEEPAVVADAAQIIGRRRSGALVQRLIELTLHPDDNVAVAAIEGLGRIGGRAAVDTLIESVKSGSFFRTFPAIDILGRSGDPRVVGPLAELLEDERYAFEAARALGRTGDKRAVEPLATLLSRGGGALWRVAVRAIAELEDSHAARYGESDAIEEAVRRSLSAAGAIPRLTYILPAADPAEQMATARVLGALGDSSAVPVLATLLEASPPVAAAAASALERIGRSGEREVIEALRRGGSERRRVLLPRVSSRAGIDALVACLDDPDQEVQQLAAEALARTGDPAAVPHLFRCFDSSSRLVTEAAVSAIQSLGGPEAHRLALEAARSPLVEVRRSAMRILSYFGYAESAEVLIEALRDPDERVRAAAIFGLPFLEDPRAMDALLEATRHPAPRTRASVMRALGQVSGDLRATSNLLRGLTDSDPWVRYYACQSLGRAGFDPAVGLIALLLEDPAGQVQVAAVEALSHLQNEEAFRALRQAAEAEDPDVRRAALVGLGIQRRPAALPIILEAAESADGATRLVALSAAAGFDGPEVLEALTRAARDADPSIRSAAIGFLAGVPSVEATRRLVELLDLPAAAERAASALALPVEGRVPGILSALQESDDESAPSLASALARMQRPEAAAALLEALTLPNVPARKAAATTLAAMATDDATAALSAAAARDPDPEVRRICEAGLAS